MQRLVRGGSAGQSGFCALGAGGHLRFPPALPSGLFCRRTCSGGLFRLRRKLIRHPCGMPPSFWEREGFLLDDAMRGGFPIRGISGTYRRNSRARCPKNSANQRSCLQLVEIDSLFRDRFRSRQAARSASGSGTAANQRSCLQLVEIDPPSGIEFGRDKLRNARASAGTARYSVWEVRAMMSSWVWRERTLKKAL